MAGVTVERAALTESDRTILRAFGVDEPAAAPDGDLHTAIAAWFRDVLGPVAETENVLAKARAAWLAAGGPQRWAGAFLAPEPPPALVEALREAWPHFTPHAVPMEMPDQPLHTPRPRLRLRDRLARPARRARTAPVR